MKTSTLAITEPSQGADSNPEAVGSRLSTSRESNPEARTYFSQQTRSPEYYFVYLLWERLPLPLGWW